MTPMRQVTPLVLVALACGAAGCGTNDDAGRSTVVVPATQEAPADVDSMEQRAQDASDLSADWPTLWCQAEVGMTRRRLATLMGPPTMPDSGMVPYISVDASPPDPVGSDTWSAPGSYSFNAFYDSDLRVQQLDFGGPDTEIACNRVRVAQ